MLGQTIDNRYRIVEEMGQGEISVVYRAQDLAEKREVGLKLLSSQKGKRSRQSVLQFRQEAEQIINLDHAHILKVYSQGEYDQRPYTITEFVKARNLAEWLGEQGVQAEASLDLIAQIANGLDYAHSKGLIHRDLKPSNIVVIEDNGKPMAKLMDFGWALLMDAEDLLKQPEAIAKTFAYMSPEQSGILKVPIDQRTDLYSLGIMFYQLVCGRPPFMGKDIGEIIHQHVARKPAAPRKINPSIPELIERIILKLMAKDPVERYQTASGLKADLEEYQKLVAQGKDMVLFQIGLQDRLKELTYRTRLVGRDKELLEMKEGLDKAVTGEGSLYFVCGEAGSGKSRLIDELRAYTQSRQGMFIGGKCFQQEGVLPYKPFVDIISDYIAGVKRYASAKREACIARMQACLGELGKVLTRIIPELVDLIGEPSALVELEPEKEKHRFRVVLRDFLLNISQLDHPLVLLLDDLQWSDEGTLDILRFMAPRLSESNVLVLAAYRDNEVDETHALALMLKELRDKQIPLKLARIEVLGLPEVNKMAAGILGEQEETTLSLSRNIFEKTRGNPFFISEIMRALVRQGVVYYAEGERRWRFDLAKFDEITFSESMVGVILARIEELDKQSLEVLSRASLIGREMSFDLLLAITQQEADELLRVIMKAVNDQFLIREERRKQEVYYFVHDRVREAFYTRLGSEERSGLHNRIGGIMERENKEDIEPVLYDLAYHFTQGLNKQKAFEYSLKAAHKAKAAYANNEAIRLYNTVLDLMPQEMKETHSEVWLEVMLNLGEVYRIAGKYEPSLKCFQACVPYITDKLQKVDLLQKMGRTLFDKGETEKAAECAEEGLRLMGRPFPKSTIGFVAALIKEVLIQTAHTWFPGIFVNEKYRDDSRALVIARLYETLFYTYYFLSPMKALLVDLLRLNFCEKIRGSYELSRSYGAHAIVLTSVPWFSRARRYFERALEMSGRLENKLDGAIAEGFSRIYFGYLYFYPAGNGKEAIFQSEKGAEIFARAGEVFELAAGYLGQGFGHFIRGELREALRAFKNIRLIAQETGDPRLTSWGLSPGLISTCLGELDDKVIMELKRAVELGKEARDIIITPWLYQNLGYAHLKRREYDKAVKALEEAVDLISRYMLRGGFLGDVYWILAETYFGIVETRNISHSKRREYLKEAKKLCKKAFIWGKWYKVRLGPAYRVNGTYQWLAGNKQKAIKHWEAGIKFLKEQTEDRYQLGLIYYEAGKWLLRDKGEGESTPRSQEELSQIKASCPQGWEYLKKAEGLFAEIEARLDLQRTRELLREPLQEKKEEISFQEGLTARRELVSVLQVNQIISSILDLEELLNKVMQAAIEVTGGERGFLMLYNDKGELELRVTQKIEEEVETELFQITRRITDEVAAKREPILISDVSRDSRFKELKEVGSILCIPLIIKRTREMIGLIYVDNRLVGSLFSQEDLEVMMFMAIQAAISIENARLYENMKEKSRMETELGLGRQIQQGLFPREIPRIEGLELAGRAIPAKEIGGDYFDFISIDKELLDIVIGDVSGKGVPAGLVMVMAKTIVHSLALERKTPKQILLAFNQLMQQQVEADRFMSMLYFRWDSKQKRLYYSSAGHEHILIYRAQDERCEAILSGGVILNMLPPGEIDEVITEQELDIKAGDIVVLYTDGITEAMNREEEFFTQERLKASIERYGADSAPVVLEGIFADVNSFIKDTPQYDDITLVVMKVESRNLSN